jgi:hypothetical protein
MSKKTFAVGGMMMVGALALAQPAAAAKNCFQKAAEGTNTTEEGAKFQAHEAIFQAFDWGVWASWMSNGSTPGYNVSKPKFRCQKGGLGYTCVGQATVCKL